MPVVIPRHAFLVLVLLLLASPGVQGSADAPSGAAGVDCGFRPAPEWLPAARERASRHGVPMPARTKEHPVGRTGSSAVLSPGGAVLELGAGQLLPGNLLDLEGTTLRFVPVGGSYGVEAVPLEWDPDPGVPVEPFPEGVEVVLEGFRFPFSGQMWESLFVNPYGNLTFGSLQSAFHDPIEDRFESFADNAASMAGPVPVISPLFRRLGGHFGFEVDPDGVNTVSVRQADDLLVVTWDVSEPYREVQTFTVEPRKNRFQARLHRDGTIEMSYDRVWVRDGVVGVFPAGRDAVEIARIEDPPDPTLPAHVDVRRVDLELVGSSTLRVRFELAGDVPAPGDPRVPGLFYRLHVDLEEPLMNALDFEDADLEWFVGAFDDGGYVTGGPGVTADVEIDGAVVVLTGSLAAWGGAQRVAVGVDVVDFDDPGFPFDQTGAVTVELPAQDPRLDLSQADGSGAPREIAYEVFHHPVLPPVTDLACTVLGELGDRFDMLVFYTDFRFDSQESGAVSTGPIGDAVTGILSGSLVPEDVCSGGRLQVAQFPSWAHSPFLDPTGEDVYGAWRSYDRQVGLVSHELAHRWLTTSRAVVGGEVVDIGTVHWDFGVQSAARFPVAEMHEASPMGGGHWRENGDGTFSQLANAFYVPATAYSSLDLYLMGLLPASAVGELFVLDDPTWVGGGRYAAQRIDFTVDDVAAAHGPRLPPFAQSQREFSLGLVGIVRPGQQPSPLLLERMQAIGPLFRDYFAAATGGVGAIDLVAEAGPPTSDDDLLSLQGGRFEVSVEWRNFEGQTGPGRIARLDASPGAARVPVVSDDSAVYWFFGPDNWELMVKVLDACGLSDSFWVFSAATTSVEIDLRLTDTWTGATRTYRNPLGQAAPAITDTEAFSTCGAPMSGPPCTPGEDVACLSDDRFAVEVAWRDFDSNSGTASVAELAGDGTSEPSIASSDSGVFWFFDSANWELQVKVLDACSFSDRFWVFAAATTNVEYTLRVEDTWTGEVREYVNPLGEAAEAVTDTEAFATCDVAGPG